MNPKIVEKIFPEQVKKFKKGVCVFCGKEIKVKDFRDLCSLKEYTISGICQACQDETFKESEDEINE